MTWLSLAAAILAVAILAAAILAALAVLQILLAAGRPLGALAWGGTYRVLPVRLRIASVITVVLYAALAAALVARAIPVAGYFPLVGTWAAVVIFALGIPANAASSSHLERHVMLPTSLVLTACAITVALFAPTAP